MSLKKRVLLKISGEALIGPGLCGINLERVISLADEIKLAWKTGAEMAVVVGGGNIWRGQQAKTQITGSKGKKQWIGIERVTADYMGMLATVINALALQDALEKDGVPTRVLTAIEIARVAELYIRRRAIRHMEKGRVVIFAGGTGNPYFTTDTTAALRAIEINADILLKATQVDGVYTDDPKKCKTATRFKSLTYMDAIKKRLKIMDATALTLCMENNLPILVFNVHRFRAIQNAVSDKNIGTRISH
ncbi:MAG: UMP kinase [bacterium]